MSISIDTYLRCVAQAIKLAMPRLDTVEVAKHAKTQIDTPAILVDVESMRGAASKGDGRTPIMLRMNAYCVLSFKTEELELKIKDMTAKLLAVIDENRFGLKDQVTAASNVHAEPAYFNPAKNGYESWAISWDQIVYIGDDIWQPSGLTPSTVFVGEDPGIGLINESHYEQLTDAP